jgi:hypothetical protein
MATTGLRTKLAKVRYDVIARHRRAITALADSEFDGGAATYDLESDVIVPLSMVIVHPFLSAGRADVRERITKPVVLVEIDLTIDKPQLQVLFNNVRPIRG